MKLGPGQERYIQFLGSRYSLSRELAKRERERERERDRERASV